ncbi:MAG: M1 family aminopeptidase, partial [Ignavibacteriaceae bacterium]|nr:M1 family aminopeptidase [Ignavibacteriaceae bacterium]
NSIDNIIIAAKNLKSKYLKENDSYIEVVYGDFPGPAADSIITECKYTLNLFGKYFGKEENTYLKYVLAPFEKGGGYSRKNFISMRTKKFDYYTQSKGIAHEIAHFWWRKANTTSWEDWLNESFAEYSMLIYTRERFGIDKFNKQIEEYKDRSKNLPPIWGIDRNSNKAYSVIYEKGSVILFELENKIGKDKFLSLLRKIADNNICTTNDFLQLLEKETSGEARLWMEKQLKSA